MFIRSLYILLFRLPLLIFFLFFFPFLRPDRQGFESHLSAVLFSSHCVMFAPTKQGCLPLKNLQIFYLPFLTSVMFTPSVFSPSGQSNDFYGCGTEHIPTRSTQLSGTNVEFAIVPFASRFYLLLLHIVLLNWSEETFLCCTQNSYLKGVYSQNSWSSAMSSVFMPWSDFSGEVDVLLASLDLLWMPSVSNIYPHEEQDLLLLLLVVWLR